MSTLTEYLAVPGYLDFEMFYDFGNFFGSRTDLFHGYENWMFCTS